jgi:hypothetical protein
VKCPPVKPDENRGNGRKIREEFPVFHKESLWDKLKIWGAGSPAVFF